MHDKAVIGIIAVILTFLGYSPYFRDIFRGTTKPHVFSWFIWIVSTGTIYLLQAASGGGPGSWVTLSLTIIMAAIFILSFKNGSKDIKPIDFVFLLLAFVGIGLWLIIEQPILSIILLTTVDIAGFAPTIRKSWNDPYSETLSFYIITTFRHGLSIFALEHHTIITALYPAAWVIANALFAVILIVRRRHLAIAAPLKSVTNPDLVQ